MSKEAAAQEKSLYTFVTKLMDGSAMIDPSRAGLDEDDKPKVDPKAERHARMLFEAIVGGDDQVRPRALGAFLKRLWQKQEETALTNAIFVKLMKLERTLSAQQKRTGDEVGMNAEDFKNYVTGVDELTDEDFSTLGIPK